MKTKLEDEARQALMKAQEAWGTSSAVEALQAVANVVDDMAERIVVIEREIESLKFK